MGWPWILQRGRPHAGGQSSLSRGAMQGHVRHAMAESHTAPRAAWRPQGPRGWGPGVGYHAGTASPQPPTQGADSPGPACLSPGPAPSMPSGTSAWSSPLYPRLGAALWESAPLPQPHPQYSPLEPHPLASLPRSSSEGVGLPGVGVSTERKPGGARTRQGQASSEPHCTERRRAALPGPARLLPSLGLSVHTGSSRAEKTDFRAYVPNRWWSRASWTHCQLRSARGRR